MSTTSPAASLIVALASGLGVGLLLSIPANAAAVHKDIYVASAPPLPPMPAHVTISTASTPTPRAHSSSSWSAPTPNLPTTTLYNGQNAAKAPLAAANWGGGQGSISNDIAYGNGGNAIKIITHGLYEGAKINFSPNVALGDRSTSKNRIFQLLVRFGDPSVLEPDGDSDAFAPYDKDWRPSAAYARSADYVSGGEAGAPTLRLAQGPPPGSYGEDRGDDRAPSRGYPPQNGYPGGRYPAAPQYPGQMNGNPEFNANPDEQWTPPVQNFRILFTLANGAQADIIRPTPAPGPFDDPSTAWLGIGIPLSVLKFPDGQDNSPLASITIGGDGPAVFYVGQINLVDDTSPIYCSAGDKQDVARGDDVNLQARAQGGASMLHYSWSFDQADGNMEDAEGATTTHAFETGDKDYTVTLTVSDLDGIKKSCSSTTTIKVEE